MTNMDTIVLLSSVLILTIFYVGISHGDRQVDIENTKKIIAEARLGEKTDKWECNIWNLWYEDWKTERKRPVANDSRLYRVTSYLVKTDHHSYRHFSFTKRDNGHTNPFLEFWDFEIESFVFYDGKSLKLLLLQETVIEIIAMEFLNNLDAQKFWRFATSNKLPRNGELITTATTFETYHNLSGLGLNLFEDIKIERNIIADQFVSYTLWMFDPNENGDVKTVLLIFSSNQFTHSSVFFTYVGVYLQKVPQYIYVLNFYNEETAFDFHEGITHQRNKNLDFIPYELMLELLYGVNSPNRMSISPESTEKGSETDSDEHRIKL